MSSTLKITENQYENEKSVDNSRIPVVTDPLTNDKVDTLNGTKVREKMKINNDNNCLLWWRKYPSFGKQYFATTSGIFGATGGGVTFGFMGTLLPQIRSYITEDEGLWLAGANLLACPFGILSCSLMMSKFGRKPCLLYTNIPWLIGWSFLIAATNFWTLIIGSVLVGFSSGSITSVIVVYNSEIPQPDLRGFFCGHVNVFFNMGILISHCFGIIFAWRISLALCTIFPILCFVFTLFIPESPNWLILDGHSEQARKIFFNLRGHNDQSRHEFETLLNRRKDNVRLRKRGIASNLFSKKFFIPFGVLTTMFTVQVCTGNDLICFYAVDMIQKMSSKINTEAAILSIDVVRLISTTINCMLIEKYSRRILFFWSTGGTLLSMIALIGVMYFEQSGIVLTVTLCVFMFMMNLGLGPIPWVMIAEVFPQVIREIGSGFCHMYFYFIEFALVKISVPMMSTLGMTTMYCIFSSIVIIGSIVLIFITPKTDKISLQQIEDNLTTK